MNGLDGAKQLLAEATGTEAASVPDDARIGRFKRWDSLSHMRLILALEEAIGRRLDPDEAVEIESLEHVGALLKRQTTQR